MEVSWSFHKWGGTPKWMVNFMENPIKIDDLGVPIFLETSILICLKMGYSDFPTSPGEPILDWFSGFCPSYLTIDWSIITPHRCWFSPSPRIGSSIRIPPSPGLVYRFVRFSMRELDNAWLDNWDHWIIGFKYLGTHWWFGWAKASWRRVSIVPAWKLWRRQPRTVRGRRFCVQQKQGIDPTMTGVTMG